MKITQIHREDIFCKDYENLHENNEIDFDSKNISIIYGPNGTGKTSLAKVLEKEPGTKYNISFQGTIFTEKEDCFAHIINDQNGRNIINGETEDFILGDNIKKEYELKLLLENGFSNLFSELISILKNNFYISSKSSFLLDYITDKTFLSFISDLANVKQKGKNIDRDLFLSFFSSYKLKELSTSFNEDKFNYFLNDLSNKDSCIKIIEEKTKESFCKENEYNKVFETTDAVRILEKYINLKDCIICDSKIDYKVLLNKKKQQKDTILNSFSNTTKEIMNIVFDKIQQPDLFEIKRSLEEIFINGNFEYFNHFLHVVNEYKCFFLIKLMNKVKECVDKSGLYQLNEEYKKISQEKLEFQDDDVLFIEKFLNNCLDKQISLKRDNEKNIRIFLGDKEFLNRDRKDLKLSNGEQNFLSLSFELLKAKKTNKELIVLDDPISSFDSIYKNKIAYAIIKFLEHKKTLILSHNIDLIQLISHQKKNCFNLYYMNNTEGESNGFIYINPNEIEILIYIPKLLNLFRTNIESEILDERSFLISVVPFLRGYCMLINDTSNRDKLTNIMHGYGTNTENITQIYNSLFSTSFITSDYYISANDILKIDINNLQILKKDKYPLLAKTLIHSFIYLYLRMSVEKKLVDKYSINTKKYYMLNDIIIHSFNKDSKEDKENRAFFLSKKTLLNEFNHFEIDMNFFQPAIDITNKALNKEKKEILDKLATL